MSAVVLLRAPECSALRRIRAAAPPAIRGNRADQERQGQDAALKTAALHLNLEGEGKHVLATILHVKST